MRAIFNKSGNPLMIEFTGSNGSAMAYTTGTPSASGKIDIEKKKIITTENAEIDKFTIGSDKLISWGEDNDFPQKADIMIGKTGVLNTGLKFLRNLTLGQGIFPCLLDGLDDAGNEILKPVKNRELELFLSSRVVRRYLEKVLRDYLKFGISFVQFIPSLTGDKFAGLNTLNALHSRLSEFNAGDQYCFVSGKFPDTPSPEQALKMRVLSEYDPEWDLELLKASGGIKGQSMVYVVRDSWSNNDHYSCPVWFSAYTAGWIDIANSIPRFLLKAYEHQITLKWHIQIPYSYWEKRFPYAEFPEGSEERKTAIQNHMTSVESNLCGKENAEKPLITMYGVNEGNGRIEEEWKITALDNKSKDGDRLVTSAAANSEILFALMINPNVMGAGMPGGTYAGQSGGSNIREAFLVNIANAWIDRQNILDPLECYLRFNGVKDVELRFRNTILTTLDQGAGTKKVIS